MVANLQDEVMHDFIKFCRYIVYKDDLTQLYIAKTDAVNEFIKKKGENKKDDDSDQDPDDVDVQEAFKGHLPRQNKANELAVWEFIDKVADHSLAQYDTTLEEDLKILADDDANGN